MKARFSKWVAPTLALALAGSVLLGTAGNAHATLTLYATEVGNPGATLIVQDGSGVGASTPVGLTTGTDMSVPGGSTTPDGNITLGSTTVPITFGDFSVLGSVSTTNSPGDGLSQLISNSLSVTNNTGVSHTIDLRISDTGYTMPANPALTGTANGGFATVSGSGVTTVSGDSIEAKAFADFANTLFGTSVAVQDFTFTAPNAPGATYANSNTVAPGISAVPYSMTVELTFTLAGHNILTNRGDAEFGAPTPEPATLAMAFSALPMLGFAAWRKRRNSA